MNNGNSEEGEPVIKVIKTEGDYEIALARVEELVIRGQNRATEETNELEVLGLLVQQYEQAMYPIDVPNPIDAILFRMEQQDLQPRDLIPYIGSRSKVSEVLSGKRPLSLSMIRSLHEGLGIPLAPLVKEPTPDTNDEEMIEWERFPIREMIRRGWLEATSMINPEAALREFFEPVGGPQAIVARWRRTLHTRSGRKNNQESLIVWRTQVMRRALEGPPLATFVPSKITQDFLREVAHLSVLPNGPKAAQEFLRSYGIALIIEPQLPQTYVDGAALRMSTSNPVIGMTVRFDRLDNFWFVLQHELVHVQRHLTDEDEYVDDLEADAQGDPREQEADEVAGETLVPTNQLLTSGAWHTRSEQAVIRFARNLNVHPAIVAGRIRNKTNNYRLLNQLVGANQVRICFPEIDWK